MKIPRAHLQPVTFKNLLLPALVDVHSSIPELLGANTARMLALGIVDSEFFISSDALRKSLVDRLKMCETREQVMRFLTSLIDNFDTEFKHMLEKEKKRK